MNSTAIAEFVTSWAIVNVVAMVVLAVFSYFSSTWILDRLPFVDRWIYARSFDGAILGAENREASTDAPPCNQSLEPTQALGTSAAEDED